MSLVGDDKAVFLSHCTNNVLAALSLFHWCACLRGRAFAAVSLASLAGLGFWWICLDSVGLHGLRLLSGEGICSRVFGKSDRFRFHLDLSRFGRASWSSRLSSGRACATVSLASLSGLASLGFFGFS